MITLHAADLFAAEQNPGAFTAGSPPRETKAPAEPPRALPPPHLRAVPIDPEGYALALVEGVTIVGRPDSAELRKTPYGATLARLGVVREGGDPRAVRLEVAAYALALLEAHPEVVEVAAWASIGDAIELVTLVRGGAEAGQLRCRLASIGSSILREKQNHVGGSDRRGSGRPDSLNAKGDSSPGADDETPESSVVVEHSGDADCPRNVRPDLPALEGEVSGIGKSGDGGATVGGAAAHGAKTSTRKGKNRPDIKD